MVTNSKEYMRNYMREYRKVHKSDSLQVVKKVNLATLSTIRM